ncbi:hypothetical protein DFH06DRAFT_1205992 [Mycena polygramma]|nr:hypothetical protein DFH06DRAFT_1205992 [Mycena polygramma]
MVPAKQLVQRPPTAFWARACISMDANIQKAPESPIRQRSKLRVISTLNPRLIKSSDRVYIFPLQQQFYASFISSSTTALVPYYRISTTQMMPFPDHSSGFMYYHNPPQATPLEGSVRLRPTPDERWESFFYGKDLTLPSGAVWELNLPQLACRKALSPFCDQLLYDKLVTHEQLARCRELFANTTVTPSLTLFRLEQEFPVNFGRTINLSILGEALHRLALTTVFTETVDGVQTFPWRGTALAHFEASTRPEFAGRRVIHLRIVKIIKPVKCTLDGFEGRMIEPKDGELLTLSRRGMTPEPWACDLDRETRRAVALRALWDSSKLP